MTTPLGIPPTPSAETLHTELRTIIAASRQRLAGAVNAELTRLYWAVGERLRREVLGGERAVYGSMVIDHLGSQLSAEFGRGFETKNLHRMVQFAQAIATEGWSVRELRWRIEQKTFERAALASSEIPPGPPFAKGGANHSVPKASATCNFTSAPIPPFAKGGLGGISNNTTTAGEVEI